jgi:hypothetical protein
MRLKCGIFIVLCLSLWSSLEARSFRVSQIPNGNNFGCQNCHLSAGGGGTRNGFGNAVFSKIGSSSSPFWDASFASMDSDGDGFTNGEELGDINGDFSLDRSTGISNPGNASSLPVLPNNPPSISSTPATEAIKGEIYSYQIVASDPDQDALTYTLITGPSWLSVSSSGLVSGTPPDDTTRTVSVTIQVMDDGSSPESIQQTYVITLSSSFAGWVRTYLPDETDPAAILSSDADGDGIKLLTEFALRSSPTSSNTFTFLPTFNDQNNAYFEVDIRDDAPSLTVELEISSDLSFTATTILTGVESDPDPNDGLKRLTFTDPEDSADHSARFFRLKITHP